MARRYTQKIRAKRIVLDYFRRPHPFRSLKWWLNVLAPLCVAAWLLIYAGRGDEKPYTSGPVSHGHAMFGDQCEACHGPGLQVTAAGAVPTATQRGYFLKVSDRTCQQCHEGPVHHANETFTPACATCHLEHKGNVVLAEIGRQHCTQCHENLTTKDKNVAFETRLASFTGHPEFAVGVKGKDGKVTRVRLNEKAKLIDTAAVNLNHSKHLKVGLKGLDELKKERGSAGILQKGNELQFSCSFCHSADERKKSMEPVVFEKHCAACHPLTFDDDIGKALAAPHKEPAQVRAFVWGIYGQARSQCGSFDKPPAKDAPAATRTLFERCVALKLAKGPEAAPPADAPRGKRGGGAAEETPPADAPRGRRGGGGAAEEPPADAPRGRRGGAAAEEPPADAPRGRRGAAAAEEATEAPRGRRGGGGEAPAAKPSSDPWVADKSLKAEKNLYGASGCLYCHTSNTKPDPEQALPVYHKTNIPVRWLPHNSFDHGVHRPIGCVECHKATTSEKTSDVLLPSVVTCQQCHRDSGGARAGCVECHLYHDKTKDRDLNGPFQIKQLVQGPGSAAAGTGPSRAVHTAVKGQ
jgi:mono/diheme cytochrome c family protein